MILASIFILILAYAIYLLYFSPQIGARVKHPANSMYNRSENFENGSFKNEYPINKVGDIGFKTFIELIKQEGKIPQLPLPIQQKDQYLTKSKTQITWLGHSTMLIETNNLRILIDPMLEDRPSPVSWIGSKRFKPGVPLNIEDLPTLDIVLISHDHYDHLDYKTIKKIKAKTKQFIMPLAVGEHLKRWDVEESKINELDWWESKQIDDCRITATPAQHFSGRGLTGQNTTQWCSFVIELSDCKLYFSADGGYNKHFSDIGKKFGPFDLSMMECGQYDRAWHDIHMMPEETIQAAIDVQSEWVLPIHWAGFKLSTHTWKDPIDRAVKAANRYGVKLTTPLIGETIEIGTEYPTVEWWK